MTTRRMPGSEVERHSAERLRLTHFGERPSPKELYYRPVLQHMSAAKRKLTPERLMADIRSYEADINRGADAKDYCEAIANYLGGGQLSSGSKGKAGVGKADTTEAQSAALIEWAEANGALLHIRLTPFNPLGPNNKGRAEHDVYFDQPSQRWIKLTKTGKFGFGPRAVGNGRWDISRSTPIEYLNRIGGVKRLFGIETPVHGVVFDKNPDGRTLPAFITSQTHIEGSNLTEAEIENHFRVSGFLKVSDSLAAYYRESDNTLVVDAHSGNMTLSPDGMIRGYDVMIAEPEGELKEIVQRDYTEALKRKPAPENAANFMDAARRVLKMDPSGDAEP